MVHNEYSKGRVKKKGLCYVNYYGDGDSKSYDHVKNTYEGLKVQKLECVGHVQNVLVRGHVL